MIRRLKSDQEGFTLIEILVVTAVSALIVGALSASIFSYFRHTESSNAHVTAATNIEEAARWISYDGQMAQSTDLTGEAVSSMNLTWIDPVNGDSHQTKYFLSGNELRRQEWIKYIDQGTRTVARHVDNINFCQPTSEENLFKVMITSSGGSPRVSETREYYVTLRAQD